MCVGKNQRGGPKRCSPHARATYETSSAALTAAENELAATEAILAAKRADIDSLYEMSGLSRNPFFEIIGDDQRFGNMPEERRTALIRLEAEEQGAARAVMAATDQVTTAQAAKLDAENDYFCTREGIGVLTSKLDTLSLEYACETDRARKQALSQDVRQTARRVSEIEQSMLNTQRERAQRWGMPQQPPVRGARLGLERADKAALVAISGEVTGSYTNTRRPDPDAQSGPDSPPEGGATLRCSRMTLSRRMPDGSRRELVCPVEIANDDDTSGPSVCQTLRTAVARADSYDDNYERWAAAHHYAPTPRSPAEWGGSRSYEEGRRAHTLAGQIRTRIDKFLEPHEYRLIRSELDRDGRPARTQNV
jgi:hypothetical protein